MAPWLLPCIVFDLWGTCLDDRVCSFSQLILISRKISRLFGSWEELIPQNAGKLLEEGNLRFV